MNIALGADHRGFALKEKLRAASFDVQGSAVHWLDVGCSSVVECDYPEYANAVVEKILSGQAELGILICGSGVGMSIAANRFAGIYAALAWNVEVARLSREHDHANILVLPADFITPEQAVAIVTAWLQATPLRNDRHERRVMMIDAVEELPGGRGGCC